MERERERPGSSMAQAYGATVTTPVDGVSLFYVVAHDGPPDSEVAALGGRVLTRLPDPRKVVALLPLAAGAGLAARPTIAAAGPINIDPERFARFARLAGVPDE